MNEKVRKLFDILGVEPNEKFKVKGYGDELYYLTENLTGCFLDEKGNDFFVGWLLKDTLINPEIIIKLPKELKTKKLRDLTEEEYEKWLDNYCNNLNQSCRDCIFNNVNCETDYSGCWINNKDLYSDKFLDQEIEVEE